MKYLILLLSLIVCFTYAEPSNVRSEPSNVRSEPIECKDELAKAIIISTTALETAKNHKSAKTIEAELKDLEENSNLLLFYYHSMYGESIPENKVERTIKDAVSRCKDVDCMLTISAKHLENMQKLNCNITKY